MALAQVATTEPAEDWLEPNPTRSRPPEVQLLRMLLLVGGVRKWELGVNHRDECNNLIGWPILIGCSRRACPEKVFTEFRIEAQKRRPSWVVVVVLGGIVERHTVAAPEAERPRRLYAMTGEIVWFVLYAPRMTSLGKRSSIRLGCETPIRGEGSDFNGIEGSLSRFSLAPVNDDLQGSMRATGRGRGVSLQLLTLVSRIMGQRRRFNPIDKLGLIRCGSTIFFLKRIPNPTIEIL